MLMESGNSKTTIAKNSRKNTFPFCPGLKNDFLNHTEYWSVRDSVLAMKATGGGRREGEAMN